MISLALFFIAAALGLTLLIVVHELGHFLVAKFCGIWVEEFGVGLPPRIWGKKFGDTLYSINALPIGGFVRLHGETADAKASKPEKSYSKKSKKVRIAVALGGIAANFLFAAVVFILLGMVQGVPSGDTIVIVTSVSDGSPAAEAGIVSEDSIARINGNEIYNTQDFIANVQDLAGQEIVLTLRSGIEENAPERDITLTPRENPPEGEGAVGVSITETVELYHPPIYRIDIYTVEGVKVTAFATRAIVLGIAGIFTDISQGTEPQGVAGPVGIVAIILEILRRFGFVRFMEVMAIISVNLALLNLLPIPPLDGSRVLLVLLENLFGEKRRAKVEQYAFTIGFLLVAVFFIIITATEIPRLISAGSISGFVDGILGI